MSSIEAVSAAVSALSADLAGDSVSGTDAAALLPQVAEQASRLNAALVTLTGVVDASGVWGLDRSRSAAAFVSRAARVSRAAAGSDVKLARALAGPLPLTARRCGGFGPDRACSGDRAVVPALGEECGDFGVSGPGGGVPVGACAPGVG